MHTISSFVFSVKLNEFFFLLHIYNTPNVLSLFVALPRNTQKHEPLGENSISLKLKRTGSSLYVTTKVEVFSLVLRNYLCRLRRDNPGGGVVSYRFLTPYIYIREARENDFLFRSFVLRIRTKARPELVVYNNFLFTPTTKRLLAPEVGREREKKKGQENVLSRGVALFSANSGLERGIN